MRLITLAVGAAAGYFLGSREGRKNLGKMTSNAQKFWNDPKTQEKVSQVQGQAAQKWEEAKNSDAVQQATATLQAKADGAKATVAGAAENLVKKTESDEKTVTTAVDTGADADVVSDPATPLQDEGPAHA